MIRQAAEGAADLISSWLEGFYLVAIALIHVDFGEARPCMWIPKSVDE